jgi:hypothetical protein
MCGGIIGSSLCERRRLRSICGAMISFQVEKGSLVGNVFRLEGGFPHQPGRCNRPQTVRFTVEPVLLPWVPSVLPRSCISVAKAF